MNSAESSSVALEVVVQMLLSKKRTRSGATFFTPPLSSAEMQCPAAANNADNSEEGTGGETLMEMYAQGAALLNMPIR